MNDMSRAAEYLKKTNFLLSLSPFFFIADESYFNTCQDDNGCPNVLFDVSSLKSKWERKSDTEGREGEGPRENRENKWQ